MTQTFCEYYSPTLSLSKSDQKAKWVELVESAAIRHRLLDRVLDSFCREFGEELYFRTFRGVKEQQNYLIPSVRKRIREPNEIFVK
jgi:hypothetical protein